MSNSTCDPLMPRLAGRLMLRSVGIAIAAATLLLSGGIGHAQQPAVRADHFGIAIGGGVSHSTIISGIPHDKFEQLVRDRTRPFEELTASQREIITFLREKLDINERQIRAALEILGEASVPAEQFAAKLAEMAETLKQLRSVANVAPGDDAETTSLKRQAQQGISDGNLDLADSLLQQVQQRQREVLHVQAFNAANTLVQRGKIALTQLRYWDAAKIFAEAAELIPSAEEYRSVRRDLLGLRARALSDQGSERADVQAASMAADQYRQMVASEPADGSPVSRAQLWYALARSLLNLSYRDGNREHLREAISALRRALDRLPREDSVADWIVIKQQLAITLMGLGLAESDATPLSEAVDLFRSLVSESTIAASQHRIGETRSMLGFSLAALGRFQQNPALLHEATETMRAGLANFDPDDQPLEWARVNAFLATILTVRGMSEGDTALIAEAISCQRAALTKLPRERLPVEWAQVQMTMGTSLLTLGKSTAKPEMLKEAVDALRAAQLVVTADNTPGDWALSNIALGEALVTLGGHRNDTGLIAEGIAALEASFAMRHRLSRAYDWKALESEIDASRKLLSTPAARAN